MKLLIIFICTISILSTIGCGSVSTYTPNPNAFRLDLSQIPTIPENSTVSLINGHHSNEEVVIGQMGRVTWKGDLRLWTDSVVNQVARRLKAAEVTLNDNSQKKLELAITEAEVTFGWVMTRCVVNLEVKTGDGDVFNFKGDHRATAVVAYLPKVVMDGAVSNAATNMVNDPEILRYLKQ